MKRLEIIVKMNFDRKMFFKSMLGSTAWGSFPTKSSDLFTSQLFSSLVNTFHVVNGISSSETHHSSASNISGFNISVNRLSCNL
jgi:hypothetical protein